MASVTEKVEKQVDTCNIVLSVLRVVVILLFYVVVFFFLIKGSWDIFARLPVPVHLVQCYMYRIHLLLNVLSILIQ